jgi:hypothetical protein
VSTTNPIHNAPRPGRELKKRSKGC